jgi:Xaa-Pro aminopeptidase
MTNLGVSEIIAIVTILATVISVAVRMQILIAANDAKAEARVKAIETLFEAKLNAVVEKLMDAQKANVELMNVKIGTLQSAHEQHREAIWSAMRGVQRITGKAHVFNSDVESDK